LRKEIESRYPNAIAEDVCPEEQHDPKRLLNHLLYMISVVEKLLRTDPLQRNPLVRFINRHLNKFGLQLYEVELVKRSGKAARWIGWMLFAAEELKLWDNTRSRSIVRRDVDSGFDIPSTLH
jgi:hypothetical protein